MRNHFTLLKTIGRNIRLLRVSQNWTQEQLAEKARISEKEVSHIENGQRNITINTMFKIASSFQLQVEDLLKPELIITRQPVDIGE